MTIGAKRDATGKLPVYLLPIKCPIGELPDLVAL